MTRRRFFARVGHVVFSATAPAAPGPKAQAGVARARAIRRMAPSARNPSAIPFSSGSLHSIWDGLSPCQGARVICPLFSRPRRGVTRREPGPCEPYKGVALATTVRRRANLRPSRPLTPVRAWPLILAPTLARSIGRHLLLLCLRASSGCTPLRPFVLASEIFSVRPAARESTYNFRLRPAIARIHSQPTLATPRHTRTIRHFLSCTRHEHTMCRQIACVPATLSLCVIALLTCCPRLVKERAGPAVAYVSHSSALTATAANQCPPAPAALPAPHGPRHHGLLLLPLRALHPPPRRLPPARVPARECLSL
jgi:hypothetical protein